MVVGGGGKGGKRKLEDSGQDKAWQVIGGYREEMGRGSGFDWQTGEQKPEMKIQNITSFLVVCSNASFDL